MYSKRDISTITKADIYQTQKQNREHNQTQCLKIHNAYSHCTYHFNP